MLFLFDETISVMYGSCLTPAYTIQCRGCLELVFSCKATAHVQSLRCDDNGVLRGCTGVPVTSVKFDYSGQYLAVGGQDARVYGVKQDWGLLATMSDLPKKVCMPATT